MTRTLPCHVPYTVCTVGYTGCKRILHTAVNDRFTVYTAVFTVRVHGRRCPAHGLYTAEAEAKAETDSTAEAKVVVTRTLTVGWLKSVEVRRHAKFGQNRSNRGRASYGDFSIF